MANLGIFDADLDTKSWFDPTIQDINGWYDYGLPFEHEFITTGGPGTEIGNALLLCQTRATNKLFTEGFTANYIAAPRATLQVITTFNPTAKRLAAGLLNIGGITTVNFFGKRKAAGNTGLNVITTINFTGNRKAGGKAVWFSNPGVSANGNYIAAGASSPGVITTFNNSTSKIAAGNINLFNVTTFNPRASRRAAESILLLNQATMFATAKRIAAGNINMSVITTIFLNYTVTHQGVQQGNALLAGRTTANFLANYIAAARNTSNTNSFALFNAGRIASGNSIYNIISSCGQSGKLITHPQTTINVVTSLNLIGNRKAAGNLNIQDICTLFGNLQKFSTPVPVDIALYCIASMNAFGYVIDPDNLLDIVLYNIDSLDDNLLVPDNLDFNVAFEL